MVLVSWRQEVLERQIDYGAQLGHVILSLARMELKNFFRNVMPVAEYFDRSGMLIEVNMYFHLKIFMHVRYRNLKKGS